LPFPSPMRSGDPRRAHTIRPGSRELMQRVASGDLDSDAMPFMSVREMDVGLASCRVARISFTGELGYEIYVPAVYARPVYDRLVEAGQAFGIRPFGTRALVSMGMEKSFGIWSREFTPDYTPVMCGMDRWVDYDKAEFIGREATLRDRDAEPPHRLVALEIDSIDADNLARKRAKDIEGYYIGGFICLACALGLPFLGYIIGLSEPREFSAIFYSIGGSGILVGLIGITLIFFARFLDKSRNAAKDEDR